MRNRVNVFLEGAVYLSLLAIIAARFLNVV
jgi:hypothetical protein